MPRSKSHQATRRNALIGLLTATLFALFLHRTLYMGMGDFEAYQNAAGRWWAGQQVYIEEHPPFKYLPGALLLFLPFAFLQPLVGKLAFFLISFAAATSYYFWTARRHGWPVAAVTFAVILRFHNSDFNCAQVNALILGLWAVLQWMLNQRHISRAASILAVIGSFKVLPLAGFGAFALKRQWRALSIGAAVFVGLNLAVALFTPDGTGVLSHWYALMRATTPVPAPDSEIIQSVQAAVWFWCQRFGMPAAFSVFFPLVSVGFLISIAGRLSQLRQRKAPLSLLLEVAMGLTVVFSPLAWKHSYVLLAPLVTTVAAVRGYKIAALHSLGLVLLPTLLSALWGSEVAERSYLTLLGALILIWHTAGLRSQQTPRHGHKDTQWV